MSKVKMIPMIMCTTDDLPLMTEVAQNGFTVDGLLRSRFDTTKKAVDSGDECSLGYQEQSNKSMKVITIFVQDSNDAYEFIVAKSDLKK